MTGSRATLAFAVVAGIAALGELVFLAANVRAFHSIPRAVWWTSAYFTDWTGALIALVCALAATRWRALASPFWLGLATVAGVLIGTVVLVLGGWTQLWEQGVSSLYDLSSLLARVIAPWAMLLAWLFAVEHGGLRSRHAAGFILMPLAYLALVVARRVLGDDYPYPQLDPGSVGLVRAVFYAGVLTLLFPVLGLVLVAVDRLLRPPPPPPLSRVVDPVRGDGEVAGG